MAENQQPIPVVLKDGKHMPLKDGEYISGVYPVADSFEGDGSINHPLKVKFANMEPFTNRAKAVDGGLFVDKAHLYKQDGIIDFMSNKTVYPNGFCYFSGAISYQSWVNSIGYQPKILSMSWFGQSHFFSEIDSSGSPTTNIPYSLVALDWKKEKYEIIYHILAYKVPSYVKHFLKDGILQTPLVFHHSIMFHYI
ncbi:hypothetical protein [Xenorhabdus entomophaga]|uniref:hypothetical protein n=1 Tax=Xenorhabdus entomophaga TaxID=3136257 RepID=UPI0030F41A59